VFDIKRMCEAIITQSVSYHNRARLFDLIHHYIDEEPVVKETIVSVFMNGCDDLHSRAEAIMRESNLIKDPVVQKYVIGYYIENDRALASVMASPETIYELEFDRFMNADIGRLNRTDRDLMFRNMEKPELQDRIFQILLECEDNDLVYDIIKFFVNSETEDCSGRWITACEELLDRDNTYNSIRIAAIRLMLGQLAYNKPEVKSRIVKVFSNNIELIMYHDRSIIYSEMFLECPELTSEFDKFIEDSKDPDKFESPLLHRYLLDEWAAVQPYHDKHFKWFGEFGQDEMQRLVFRTWTYKTSLYKGDIEKRRILLANIEHREINVSDYALKVFNASFEHEDMRTWIEANIGKVPDGQFHRLIKVFGESRFREMITSNLISDTRGDHYLTSYECAVFCGNDFSDRDSDLTKLLLSNLHLIKFGMPKSNLVDLLRRLALNIHNNAVIRNWAIQFLEDSWEKLCRSHGTNSRDIVQVILDAFLPVIRKYKTLYKRMRTLLLSHKHALVLWRNVRTQYRYFFEDLTHFVKEAASLNDSKRLAIHVEGFTVCIAQTKFSWGCNEFRWNDMPTLENTLDRARANDQSKESILFGWEVVNIYRQEIRRVGEADPDGILYAVGGEDISVLNF
jgi:hypothetical protein